MSAPAADDSAARLVVDPAALSAGIERYLQLKKDAESKMRAVVDEASANELLANATKALAKAEDTLHQAQLKASEMLQAAQVRAEEIKAAANGYVATTKANADSYATEKKALADQVLATAKAKLAALDGRQWETDKAVTDATSAKAEAARLKAEYESALDEVHALQDKLVAVRKAIVDVLK